MKRILLLVLVCLGVLLAACSAATPTPEEGCEKVDAVNEAIQVAEAAGQADSINTVIAAQTQLINAWSDLMKAVDKIDNAELNAAVDGANDAIMAIPVATQENAVPVAQVSLAAQATAAQNGIAPVMEYCQTLP